MNIHVPYIRKKVTCSITRATLSTFPSKMKKSRKSSSSEAKERKHTSVPDNCPRLSDKNKLRRSSPPKTTTRWQTELTITSRYASLLCLKYRNTKPKSLTCCI